MSTLLHETNSSENISMGYIPRDVSEENETLVDYSPENCSGDSHLIKTSDFVSQVASLGAEDSSSDPLKPYPMKEGQETSPFKLAVKGFVLNKLSKKVANSHLLSGLTEKLVKKLEEPKENSIVSNPNANFEKPRLAPVLKESNVEGSFDVAPCELKSVVANEQIVPELSTVEEATECFEEAKASSEDSEKLNVGRKIVSRSLPSSPAHQFDRRSSVGLNRCSDVEEMNLGIESTSVPSLNLFQDLFVKTSLPNHENEIELQENVSSERNGSSSQKECNFLLNEHPENVFVIEKGQGSRRPPKNILSYKHAFHAMKKLFLSLSLPHLILLASLLIHNSNFLSSYYVHYFLDSFVIAYLGYTIICILMQTPTTNVAVHPIYDDTHLEKASLSLDQENKTMKGSAKILKGKYDPEEILPSTELVSICIENQYLKIYQTPKDIEDFSLLLETYRLCGGQVSLVPKGLNKKRIFHRKYPICITLPHVVKKSCDTFEDMDKEEKTDYISLVSSSDGLTEIPKQRAIYLFALSDREKESLFWALFDNINLGDSNFNMQNTPQSVCSSEFDLSSISYSSLLDTDESLSITEDSSGKTTEIKLIPGNSSLTFANYSRALFENYEKEVTEQYRKLEYSPDSSKDILKGSYSVEWLNVVLGRMFYDFLTQKIWSDYVLTKIQKKLDKIDLPTFVESLKITEVAMGDSIPQLHSVSNPTVDKLGVWFDFDFIYKGSFQMTLKAKMKMPKGRQLQTADAMENPDNKINNEACDNSDEDGTGSRTQSPTQSKLINRIEKWISHKHFQTVAQSRFVKKYVGDISNMTLTLTVEVNKLQGIMTFNIPPVPSDRVWYGFRNDPVLSLTASPKVGTHEINLSAIVQMIERKLDQAFKKALVMPNMDDFVIPIMFSPIYDQ